MAAVVQLCTLEQVKERGVIKATTTDKDALIQTLIESVLPVFNMRFQREFMPPVTETRTFSVRNRVVFLDGCDLASATAAVLDKGGTSEKTLVAGRDYILDIDDRDFITKTWQVIDLSRQLDISSDMMRDFGFSQIDITGTWGCWADVSAVPADVNAAAIETVLSWMSKPAASIAAAVDSGGMRDMAPVTPSTWDIPSSAWRKMQPYSRNLGVW